MFNYCYFLSYGFYTPTCEKGFLETINGKKHFSAIKVAPDDEGCYVFLKKTKTIMSTGTVNLKPVHCNSVCMSDKCDDFHIVGCYESANTKSIGLTIEELKELKSIPQQKNGYDFIKWYDVGCFSKVQ